MRASIIITMYNSESTIRKVIDQLLKIIDKDDEVIIVDDASNDNSVKVVKNYKDIRINLILSEHIGRAKALNKAVQASNGEYVFINDADDISSEVRLKDSIYLLKSGTDAIFGQALLINDIGKQKFETINISINKINTNKPKKIRLLKKNNFFKSNNLHHSSLAMKRELLLEVGCYDENLDVCIDLDLYFRLVQKKLKLAICEKIFVARNIGSSRVFAKFSKKKYLMNLILLRKKYRSIIKPSIYTYLYDIRLKILYLLSK